MTEMEKMLAGKLYDHRDPELVAAHKRAIELMFAFNQTRPDEEEKRQEILRRLINSKSDFHVEPNFRCDYGFNIWVGDNFYANYDCTILDVCKVTIGNDVLLAPGVQILTATHPVDPAARLTQLECGKPVTIGNNVWIGGGAIICPGASVGDNCVIGAGSVVTKNIPADTVAVGNPARILRSVFDVK